MSVSKPLHDQLERGLESASAAQYVPEIELRTYDVTDDSLDALVLVEPLKPIPADVRAAVQDSIEICRQWTQDQAEPVVIQTKTKAEIIHMLKHDLNGEVSTANLLFEMLEQWTGYETMPVDKRFILLTQTRHIVETAKKEGRL